VKDFRIKVCGITRLEDATFACSLGADMIGMIFSDKSPRFLSAPAARIIAGAVQNMCIRVGVFVNEEVRRILDTASSVGLDMVQLHGDETESEVKTIRDGGVKVIKAFAISKVTDFESVLKSNADYVMIDNRESARHGGTGRTFDWSIMPPQPVPNLVLAGGINHDNVADGVARFHPAVVDVNSGVETEPGIKSPDRLKQFFEECDRIRHGK
jgi:phosphoribosylanthranilate isomerase